MIHNRENSCIYIDANDCSYNDSEYYRSVHAYLLMSEHGLGTFRDVLKTKGEKFFHTSGDAFVIDAVKQMVEHNIRSLIIVEGLQKRPMGIVTETDYLNKVIVLGHSSNSTLVTDIMSTEKFTYVYPAATLHDCMQQLMTDRRIRHIPVVDGASHKVLGMVSIGDIVSELVAAHNRNAEHLQSFIAGSHIAPDIPLRNRSRSRSHRQMMWLEYVNYWNNTVLKRNRQMQSRSIYNRENSSIYIDANDGEKRQHPFF